MPEKRYITMRHFDMKRKFVPITHFEKCIDWIEKEKKYSRHVLAEIKQYNHENVWDAHKLLEQMLEAYSNSYNELNDGSNVPSQRNHQRDKAIIHEYSKLLEENINNLKTLRIFLEISLLENPLQELSHRMEETTVGVVQEFEPNNGSMDVLNDDNNIYKCLQELEGMKSSWDWIEDLLKCLIVHVRQASAYCQFHYDLHALLEFISEFRHVIEIDRFYDDSYSSALRLAGEIQAAEIALRSLKEKVAKVTKSFHHVLPVHLRTQSTVVEKVPGILICGYSTKEANLKAGEEVVIMDRWSLYTWKVRTSSGVIVTVPSIIIVIPGHDDDSLKTLNRLHDMTEDVVEWTIKKMNKRLNDFLLKVFRTKYTNEEMRLTRELPLKTKTNLSNFVNTIVRSMSEVKKSPEVLELEGRLATVRGIIEPPHHVAKDTTPSDNGYGRCLVVQLNVLQYLMEMFNSLKFLSEERVPSIELPMNPLKCENFINHEVDKDLLDVEEVLTRIDEIICNSRDVNDGIRWTENVKEETADASTTFVQHVKDLSRFASDLELPPGFITNGFPSQTLILHDCNNPYDAVEVRHQVPYQKLLWRRVNDSSELSSHVKISEAEQFFAVEMEENKKFVIKSVVDPSTKEDISLFDAIARGFVDSSAGTYLVSVEPRETISISAAMFQNFIKVQSTTVRKSNEKKSSVGLVTVKTKTKHERRGWVESVFDHVSESFVALEEAERKGLINLSRNIVKDLKNVKEYTIEEADDMGWIGRTSVFSVDDFPETKVTYAVRGVLDRRRQKMLAYHEACRSGLMDRETSTYFDIVSGKKYPIEEAISNNFVKADVVEDPKSMDFWKDT